MQNESAGLKTATEIDARRAYELANTANQARGNSLLQYCAHCNTVPLTATGSLAETKARRWHCPEHAHLAQPGDLEDRPAPWLYSAVGAIIEAPDETEQAREAAAAESRERAREAQAPDRALEVEERRKHQQAVADETRRLVPPGVWA